MAKGKFKVDKEAAEEKRLSYPKCPTCLRSQTLLELPDGTTRYWCINCESWRYNVK